jgi:hypothetical protein
MKAWKITTRKITGFLQIISNLLFFFAWRRAPFHSKVEPGAFTACRYQGSPLNFVEIFYRYPWQVQETGIHSYMT